MPFLFNLIYQDFARVQNCPNITSWTLKLVLVNAMINFKACLSKFEFWTFLGYFPHHCLPLPNCIDVFEWLCICSHRVGCGDDHFLQMFSHLPNTHNITSHKQNAFWENLICIEYFHNSIGKTTYCHIVSHCTMFVRDACFCVFL